MSHQKARTTPGPWIAVGRRVEHPNDAVPDICTTDPEALGQEGRSDAECCANARLIAAAPDLLAVAIRAEKWIASMMVDELGWPEERVQDPPKGSHLHAIRAAIAKATGSDA